MWKTNQHTIFIHVRQISFYHITLLLSQFSFQQSKTTTIKPSETTHSHSVHTFKTHIKTHRKGKKKTTKQTTSTRIAECKWREPPPAIHTHVHITRVDEKDFRTSFTRAFYTNTRPLYTPTHTPPPTHPLTHSKPIHVHIQKRTEAVESSQSPYKYNLADRKAPAGAALRSSLALALSTRKAFVWWVCCESFGKCKFAQPWE